MTLELNRRRFLASAGVALVVPIAIPHVSFAQSVATQFNPYLRLEPDGIVTLFSPVSEMGQGTHTGHAQIVADELGVDISTIRISVPEQPAEPYRLIFGQMRSVGSFGIRSWIEPLRLASAQARTVLIEAAAQDWGVDAATLDTENGLVRSSDGARGASFAELLASASELRLPNAPTLRGFEGRRYVGEAVPRIDTPQKLDGSAVFGIDVRLPDMLFGAVRLSPTFGAEVARIDPSTASDARALVEVPGGAVVVADRWWTAKQMADGLDIEWGSSPHANVSSADLTAAMRAGLDQPEAPAAASRGDATGALEASAQVVEADYEVPFLAHAALEPIACVGQLRDGRCDVWMSTQGHDVVRVALEEATGLPASAIYIHTTFLGGAFGRKTHGEVAVEAVLASKAVEGRPVKVVWAREDDMRQGQYRPAMTARMRAALSTDGSVEAMHIRLSGPMMGREYSHITIEDGVDFFSHAVLLDQPYCETNFLLDHHEVTVPPSTCPWRAVSSSQNGFFLEAFADELAAAAGQDPIEWRRAQLADRPSHIAVLDSVARRSNWSSPLPGPNWGRGVAIVESYNSRVAQVVEVEMLDDIPVVRRVTLAIDCGEAINPGQVRAQMEGSIIDGLGPALRCQITLQNGGTVQGNYDDYPILRIPETPEIDIEIVNTGAPIGGVGEPGIPPLAPAVANAVFAATGQRRRVLPLAPDT